MAYWQWGVWVHGRVVFGFRQSGVLNSLTMSVFCCSALRIFTDA
jgi:hypothetical protein